MVFALGAALSRVSLCAVAGVQQAIAARSYTGLKRLLLAASAAAATLLLCAALAPHRVRLPADVALHWGVIAGALMLGVGALINGGCYLGSVLYLGSGNLNFVFTLGGIGLGARGAELLAPIQAGAGVGLRMAPAHVGLAGVMVLALTAGLLLRGRGFKERWPSLAAGVLAGLLYAQQPGWSYGSVIETLAHGRLGLMNWQSNASALLLFAGALAGSTLAGRFQLQRPQPWRSLRCVVSGAIMGCGAAWVPGGSDSLLLWAIPGLAVYGALAYALMLGTIGLGLTLSARWGQQRSDPISV